MKIKKALKRVLLVLTTLIVIIGILAAVFLGIKPAVQTKKLSSLSMDDSPLAEYASLIPDNDEIYSWATDLVDMGARLPGTKAGTRAQNYVKEKFEEFGLEDVSIIPSKSTLYTCDDWSLSVDGTEMESFYIGYSNNDGTCHETNTNANAELVYVGDDIGNTDVRGKIVVADISFSSIPYAAIKAVADLYYDPDGTLSLTDSQDIPYVTDNFYDIFFEAQNAGAAGFIGILTDYIDSCEYHNENYSYINDYDMSLPGLWVSNQTGETIKSMISGAETPVTANLKMNSSLTEIEAGAVVGFVRGTSEETIMVQSHYDSITAGGVEDASGCSAMMAMAKFWSQMPQENIGKTILFIATDTHFSDYDTHDSVLAEYYGEDCNIVGNLCVEHIANQVTVNEDGSCELSGDVEPRIVFVSGGDKLVQITNEEIVRHGMKKTIVLPASILGDELFTDADEFYQEGTPVVNLISGPVYLYDTIDTADKIAKDQLNPTAYTMSDILARLMNLSAEELKGE